MRRRSEAAVSGAFEIFSFGGQANFSPLTEISPMMSSRCEVNKSPFTL